ncbi:SoxR reducing system RseC family protein [Shewanella gaetbuli]|uniref:SoxR reducing system RseC family protein n=1 Tax=Shewanella gaetbuli TaxID=220752 RepID=A0A9X2CKA5_9GAMM|nr:SoxR reducing system RseC family protein [Shewanella gaetbuli]MCL1141424.1 SoxR reducing system RseC family protein [Shewanella gaetbuli]
MQNANKPDSQKLTKPLLEELAKVIEYQAGWAVVEVELKSACNHCSSNDNCGTSTIAKAFSVKTQRFSVASDEVLHPGDMLKVGLPESVIIQAAALVYLLPLLGLFLVGGLGLFLAQLIGIDKNLSSMLFGVVGAYAFWRLGKNVATRLEQDAQPIIIQNLGQQVELSVKK